MNPLHINHLAAYHGCGQFLLTVARRLQANMNPAACRHAGLVALKDKLVVIAILLDPSGQVAISNAGNLNVRRFALAMLAGRSAADQVVDLKASKTAVVNSSRVKCSLSFIWSLRSMQPRLRPGSAIRQLRT